jgi:hypothetical protein
MKLYCSLIVCGCLVLVMGAISPAGAQGFSVMIDIKPQSCPNPMNVNSKGVVSVAVLGTEDFDVMTVDPASVELADVAPLRWNWEDVSTPADNGDPYACTTEGPDGMTDLVFKFKTQEIVEALNGDVSDGDEIFLYLTGRLLPEYNESPFAGRDWVIIIKKGKSNH